MKKIKFLLLAAVAMMMSATCMAADADFPARPDTAIFVHDFAGVLKADQVKAMDDSLRAFSKRTTNQIMVITVKDLGDYDLKMYAAELGDRWGVGQKKLDNGLIVLIKPKTDDSKGQFALCPGRGLNGALPDVTCKRIIDTKAIPELKKNNYDDAVWAVLKTVMPVCAGEISGEEALKKKSTGDGNGWMWFVGIFGAIVGGVAYSNARAKKKQALLEATETPEERAARLAAAEQRKKELEEQRKRREAERAAAAAAAAATGVFKSDREKREEEERCKRENAEKFGGGTFDGGGASSEW